MYKFKITHAGMMERGILTRDDCGAQNITIRRVIFTPENAGGGGD